MKQGNWSKSVNCVTNVTYTAGLCGLLLRKLTEPLQHFITLNTGVSGGRIDVGDHS